MRIVYPRHYDVIMFYHVILCCEYTFPGMGILRCLSPERYARPEYRIGNDTGSHAFHFVRT